MLKQAEWTGSETQAIYWALFRGTIPPLLAQRYEQATRKMDRTANARELAALGKLVAYGADLEAAELAARLTGRLPLLTRRFQAMAFLAETLPDHQRYYVSRRSSLPGALILLAWQSMMTAIKLARGLWLLRSVRRG